MQSLEYLLSSRLSDGSGMPSREEKNDLHVPTYPIDHQFWATGTGLVFFVCSGAIIDAHAPTPIFLRDKKNGCSIWALRRANMSLSKQIIDLRLQFFMFLRTEVIRGFGRRNSPSSVLISNSTSRLGGLPFGSCSGNKSLNSSNS